MLFASLLTNAFIATTVAHDNFWTFGKGSSTTETTIPHGSYCSTDDEPIVNIRMSFNPSSSMLDFHASEFFIRSQCLNEQYTYDETNKRIILTNFQDEADCLHKFAKKFGLDTSKFSMVYNDNTNTISVDVGIGTTSLIQCNEKTHANTNKDKDSYNDVFGHCCVCRKGTDGGSDLIRIINGQCSTKCCQKANPVYKEALEVDELICHARRPQTIDCSN
eukprot:g589.t1